MSDLDIVVLAEAHTERWFEGIDGDDGYQCRGCQRDMYLTPGLEPQGLCDVCVSEVLAAVPAEIAQLRAELAKHAAIVEAAKAWRACFDDEGEICTSISAIASLADAVDAAGKP